MTFGAGVLCLDGIRSQKWPVYECEPQGPELAFFGVNSKVVLTTVGSPCPQQSITVTAEDSMEGNLSVHNVGNVGSSWTQFPACPCGNQACFPEL